MICRKALFSTYLTLSLLLNLKGSRRTGQLADMDPDSSEDFRLMALLGPFSGFNEVPLLQTLEAVLENAALWLQSRDITTNKNKCKQICSARVIYCLHVIPFRPKPIPGLDLSEVEDWTI